MEQVPTAVKGTEREPERQHLDDFQFHEDAHGGVVGIGCPNGQRVPVEPCPKAEQYTAHFEAEACGACPFQEEFPTRERKRERRRTLKFSWGQADIAQRWQRCAAYRKGRQESALGHRGDHRGHQKTHPRGSIADARAVQDGHDGARFGRDGQRAAHPAVPGPRGEADGAGRCDAGKEGGRRGPCCSRLDPLEMLLSTISMARSVLPCRIDLTFNRFLHRSHAIQARQRLGRPDYYRAGIRRVCLPGQHAGAGLHP